MNLGPRSKYRADGEAIHILVLGQSNVASHGRPARASAFGYAFHDNTMKPLSDPIPGGTGDGGSVWTRFAPRLQDAGLAREFVITLRADGGTSVLDWSEHGKCFKALIRDLAAIQSCPIPVTHVLYHQGERDTFLGTDKRTYVRHFTHLHEAVGKAFPQAPWIVCRASYRKGVVSEAVRQAQEEIIARFPNCRPGPDTDRLGAVHRFDDTHFNEKGLEAFATELLGSFSKKEKEDDLSGNSA